MKIEIKKVVDKLIEEGYIPKVVTGKLNIEINLNQGGVTDIYILPKIKI